MLKVRLRPACAPTPPTVILTDSFPLGQICRQQFAGLAQIEEVLEEDGAEDEAAEADQAIPGSAGRLADFHELVRCDPLHRQVLAGEEHHKRACGQHNAALEAAAGRDVAVRHDVAAEHDHLRDQRQCKPAQRVARAAERVTVGLLCCGLCMLTAQ